jgi:hypothetical protein
MAIQRGGDLIGRLACPALGDYLGMKLPIGGRVMAPGQFANLAFFLLILRCSGLHVFGHGSALSHSETLPPPILIPMRNAAVTVVCGLGILFRFKPGQ